MLLYCNGQDADKQMRMGIGVVSTRPISVALAEGDVAEAHSAVADNDEAGQAGELGVLHCHISRQVCKAQHQSIVCTHADHILSAALLHKHCSAAYTLHCTCTWYNEWSSVYRCSNWLSRQGTTYRSSMHTPVCI